MAVTIDHGGSCLREAVAGCGHVHHADAAVVVAGGVGAERLGAS